MLIALPKRFRELNPGDKIHKAASIMTSHDVMDIYMQLISHWKSPQDVVIGGNEPAVVQDLLVPSDVLADPASKMMFLDSISYLPDDILVKVDRAAMGVSLETRVPFLDHRVIEMAWRLPHHMKIRDGAGKWCLREMLYKRVPRTLIERPKTGFGCHWKTGCVVD